MDNEKDTKLLPLILQHVRELTETHTGLAGNAQYKILTPFPPVFNDFPDFQKDHLDFRDAQLDPIAAQSDTNEAFDFYRNTDFLYYDYSYGIKLEEPTLTKICDEFYLNSVFVNTADASFTASFAEKKDTFLRKCRRQTVPQETPFIYTAYSPIRWENNRIVITSEAVNRLKEKALSVYANAGSSSEHINSLLAQIKSASYSKIEYDFGFFDVIRDWFDSALLESREWKFSADNKVLYGANDPAFEANDVKLCYAKRFYVVKNYSGTPKPPGLGQLLGNILIRDHIRPEEVVNKGGVQVRDPRRTIERDRLLDLKISSLVVGKPLSARPATVGAAAGMQPPGPGFVWVPATDTVAGHWERERAKPKPPAAPVSGDNTEKYKVAAVLCRIIPRKPAAGQPA
jgi:hypothetical protein